MFYNFLLGLAVISVFTLGCKKNEDNSAVTPTTGVTPPTVMNPAPETNNHFPLETNSSQNVPTECLQPVTNQPAFGQWKKTFSDSNGIQYFVELRISNTHIEQRLRCSIPQTQRWIDTNVRSRVEFRFNVMSVLETDTQDILNDGDGGDFRCYNYLFKSVVNYQTKGSQCLVINPGPSADYYTKQ